MRELGGFYSRQVPNKTLSFMMQPAADETYKQTAYLKQNQKSTMGIYQHFDQLHPDQPPCALTIGSFDGLHRGHQLLLSRVLEAAGGKQLQSAALTFHPHPAKLLAPRLSPPLLTTYQRKSQGLSSLGLDVVLDQHFDHHFAMLSAEDFVRVVLVDKLHTAHVIVGDDFTFGRERRGLTEDLTRFGAKYNFSVEVVRRLCVEGVAVSSTRIRSFLLQGRTRAASLLLGRPYVIEGCVVRGDGRGHTLGFATANLQTQAEVVPGNGVYATYVWVESSPDALLGVTNIGTRPTFGENQLSIETHILDFQTDLVGKHFILGFIERLRSERTFANQDALIEQIDRDITETRAIDAGLGGRPSLSKLDGNLIDSSS